MAEKAPKEKKQRLRWLAQIRSAYQLGRKGDPALPWWLLGVFVLTWLVVAGLGALAGSLILFIVIGFFGALAATSAVFGQRVQRSVYRQVEGTPGASLQALSTLRRGFSVDAEPVAVNKNQDLVMRVVGKCGVVLVGEGSPTRVPQMLVAERRRHQRALGDIPVHEIQVGNGEGQVPLRKLSRAVAKLPRTLTGPQRTELDHRLKALAATQNTIPIPKGPLPKGVKIPRPPR
jgi:Domain of unknown function (DUF4191)